MQGVDRNTSFEERQTSASRRPEGLNSALTSLYNTPKAVTTRTSKAASSPNFEGEAFNHASGCFCCATSSCCVLVNSIDATARCRTHARTAECKWQKPGPCCSGLEAVGRKLRGPSSFQPDACGWDRVCCPERGRRCCHQSACSRDCCQAGRSTDQCRCQQAHKCSSLMPASSDMTKQSPIIVTTMSLQPTAVQAFL